MEDPLGEYTEGPGAASDPTIDAGNSQGADLAECSDGQSQQRGSSNPSLRRLSRAELTGTLRALLGELFDDPEIAGRIESLPADVTYKAGDFTQAVPAGLAVVLAQVARRATEMGLSSSSWRAQLAPCAEQAPVTRACMETVVQQFGARVWRRDLDAAEVQAQLELFDQVGGGEVGFNITLRRLLQSPTLVFHVEAGTETVSSGRLRLTDFEVASRIAYLLTDTMPDAALTASARMGQLSSLDAVRSHVQRLLDTELGQQKVADFARYYAHLEVRADPTPVVARHHGLEDATGLAEEMRLEALEFFHTIVFEQRGTFADLMTSPRAFPRSSALARVFGTDIVGGDEPVEAAAHPGLLHRPALLASSGERTSPIVRGAHVRKLFLCTELTLPSDVSAINAAQELLLNSDDMPNRAAVTQATSGAACQGCHALINPLGFAFEGYDQVGFVRTEEQLFDGDGQVRATLPINTEVENPLIGDDGPDRVDDSQQLVEALAQSDAGRHCLTQRFFEYYRRAPVNAALDACVMAEVAALGAEASIQDMLTRVIANEDLFWRLDTR